MNQKKDGSSGRLRLPPRDSRGQFVCTEETRQLKDDFKTAMETVLAHGRPDLHPFATDLVTRLVALLEAKPPAERTHKQEQDLAWYRALLTIGNDGPPIG